VPSASITLPARDLRQLACTLVIRTSAKFHGGLWSRCRCQAEHSSGTFPSEEFRHATSDYAGEASVDPAEYGATKKFRSRARADDGSFVIEFRAAIENFWLIIISVPASEADVLRHFQERMPDGLVVPQHSS
jgi:hypothetical protein